MNFTISFISLNKIWTEYMRLYFKDEDVNIIYDNITSIDMKESIFVSPANSLGFMDGGIDRVLNEEVFQDCREQYQAKLLELPYRTALGRPYLPVGSAIIVIRDLEQSGIIFAPTMFKPSDVSQTRNAYHSFFASLYLMKKYNGKYKKLIVTSHCCGYGMMDEEESARQMYDAWRDYMNGISKIDDSSTIDIALLPKVDDVNPTSIEDNNTKNIFIVE